MQCNYSVLFNINEQYRVFELNRLASTPQPLVAEVVGKCSRADSREQQTEEEEAKGGLERNPSKCSSCGD